MDGHSGRLGLVNGDEGLLRRLRRSDFSWRVEACTDPLAFARGSANDDLHDRVLAIVLDPPLNTGLLDALRVWTVTCPVVGLHADSDVSLRLTAIAHGVMALVARTAEPARIVRAANAVTAGDAVVDGETFNAFAALLPTTDVGADSLTDQERIWLTWLARGETGQGYGCSPTIWQGARPSTPCWTIGRRCSDPWTRARSTR